MHYPDRNSSGTVAAAPATGAWQTVARLPASNHDITAAVVGDRVYYAGGLTAEFGDPPRSKAFDEVVEIDPRQGTSRVLAHLQRVRIYCATAAFAGRLWVLGGDVVAPDGKRHAVATVECVDPASGQVTPGPDTAVARPTPLALPCAGRLFVVGCAAGDPAQVGRLESLGEGEAVWRPEPAGPAGMGALAGAVLDDKLFVVVPKQGLAVYDPRVHRWELLAMPSVPRSCQMTAWRGELWLMGGVDIQDPLQTLIYTPGSGRFRQGPPLPVALSWGGAAVVDDQLLVIGGAGLRPSPGRGYAYSDRVYALHA